MLSSVIVVGDTFSISGAIVFAGRLAALFARPTGRTFTGSVRAFAKVVALHSACFVVACFSCIV